MPATDFHHHLWPDEFRRALERRHEPPHLPGRGLLALPHGGVFDIDPDAYAPEARLAELDRAGIERAIVSLPPTTEPTADLIEAWHAGARRLARDSGGRLVPLAYGSADAAYPGAILPAAGLDRAAPVLTELERTGGFAFVHPGPAVPMSPAWRAPGVAYTQQLLDAYAWWLAEGATRWPRLRVVFALLAGGAPFQLERFVRRGLDRRAAFGANVWFETSSYGERALELSLQTFGASRLLFGSDAPVDPVDDALAAVRRFGAALEAELLDTNPMAVLDPGGLRWAA